MISAGQEPKKVNERERTANLVCGQVFNKGWKITANDQCKETAVKAIEAEHNKPQPMTPLQSLSYDYYLAVGRGKLVVDMGETQDAFKKGGRYNSDKAVQSLIDYTSKYILDDKPIMCLDGKPRKFVSEFLPWAAEQARRASSAAQDFPIPPDLLAELARLRAKGLKPLADLLERLFHQGLGQVKADDGGDPSTDDLIKASQPIAGHVLKYLKDPTKNRDLEKDYENADPKDRSEMARKWKYTHVLSTGKGDKYPIKIQTAPDSVIKLLTGKYKGLPVKRELMRLFGEAIEKAGGKATMESVAKALVAEVDALGEKDEKKLATMLLLKEVGKVDVDGKEAKKVHLQDVQGTRIPAQLIDEINAERSNAKQGALAFIMKQIYAKRGDKPMTPAIMQVIIASLLKDMDKGGLKGMSAAELAMQQVVKVAPNGKVTLKQLPDKAYGSIPGHKQNVGAYSTGQDGYVGVYLKISEILIDGLEAAKKHEKYKDMKDDELRDKLAGKLNATVRKKVDFKNNAKDRNPLTVSVGQFLLHQFKGLDENGNFIIDYRPGMEPGGGAGGTKGVVPIDEDNKVEVYTDNSLEFTPLFGLQEIQGDYTDIAVGGSSSLYIDYVYKIRTKFGGFLGVDGVYTTPIFRPGVRDNASADTDWDNGEGRYVRLGKAGARVKHKFGVNDDGSLDSFTLGLGLQAGIIPASLLTGLELALTYDRDPVNSALPIGPGSRTGGARATAVWGFEPVTGAYGSNKEEHEGVAIETSVIGGTGVGNVSSREINFEGSRLGFDAAIDIDGGGLAGTESVDWKLQPAFSLQNIWGSKAGLHFNAGGSFFFQPHENVQLFFGATYGRMYTELSGLTEGYAFGGGALFPIPLANGALVLMPGAFLSRSRVSRDKKVSGTSEEGENPGCTSGYDCSDADVGEGTGDQVGVVPSKYDTWLLGHSTIVLNALARFGFESLPGFNPYAGFILMNVEDHQAEHNDLLGGIRFGAQFKHTF